MTIRTTSKRRTGGAMKKKDQPERTDDRSVGSRSEDLGKTENYARRRETRPDGWRGAASPDSRSSRGSSTAGPLPRLSFANVSKNIFNVPHSICFIQAHGPGSSKGMQRLHR